VSFQYDALGRRVARTGTGGSFVFVQMDQQTIADYPVGGAASTPTYRYVYASYIDEPVVRKGAGAGGTLVYFHRNHQYSITAVTTSTGTIAERYAYTAYGQPTILDALASVLSSSAINNRYTYTGREWDATLGLHHFRARWKSPIAGRFLTRDPIGYKGKSFNLYQFVRGRALSRIDPSGLTDGFAYPVTICCGGKKYEFTSFDPAHGCCANKAIYEFDTECCESGSVVGKVTVWKCVRNSIAGRCFDYSLGWFTCPFGWRGRHSYVCLDGPDLNCWSASFDGIWGVYNPSDPFGDGDEGYTSSCSESKVCPSEKAGYGMSKNSGYNPIYNNCHQQSGNCWSFYW